MTIRTIPLADFPAVLRWPFEVLTGADGAPIGDRRTGETVHVAEAVVPGLVPGRFTTDDRPSAVRLKLVGSTPPALAAGQVVRLIGPRLTTWYTPRGRGADARSAATITVERIEAADGATPATRGGLPAHLDGAGVMFLGQSGEFADVMIDAMGPFTVDGVAELRCSTTVPPSLLAQPVTLLGLRAFFVQPDAADVGARSKAELILACAGIEAAPSANGRARKPEATPATVEG